MALFLVFTGLITIVFITWRLASRRHTLPCPVWLRWLVELDNPFTNINRAGTIIENLGLQSGMVIVDVGCGPGRITIPVARIVGAQGRVLALDIQRGMLDRTREKAQIAGLDNIDYLQDSVCDGKLGQNQFDRALLVTVLGEIPDRSAALQEIFNALKPGGLLSVTEIVFDPHYQRKNTVVRLAGAVGFHEKAFYGNPMAFTLNLEKPTSIN